MSQMAMQTNQHSSAQVGGANPMEPIIKHLDTVPNMIYGFIMVILIAFNRQIGGTIAGYADSALGRVLGIVGIIAATQLMGWTYGLLTALAFLLIVHSSPRLAATSIEQFNDLKRQEATGHKWFVEKVLGENPMGIATDNAITQSVQDDSQIAMSHSRSGR
jgi:hypothetical protein